MITPDQEPFGSTTPPVTWKPEVSPFISKVKNVDNEFPDLSMIPDKLLERSSPLI